MYPTYNSEYEKPLKPKSILKDKPIYNIGTDGEWHKVTFAGDSGAVDHVMKRD